MPTCRECHGSGKVKIKTEITTRCPDCDGSKLLPDGSACERCNKWGEIGTGEFEVEEKLCTTCWGSGKVSEQSLTVWFLIRVIPTTLLVLGLGGALIWGVWQFVGNPGITAAAIIAVFGLWGALMNRFTTQMPDIGEISPTNWFLSRAIPTTLTALAVGGAAVWITWVYLQNLPLVAIVGLAAVAMWAAIMYYYIIRLPE
ncbi:MAG: hypothetical protein D6768_20960 [Chloroflexi bacterium]|nr:MAG: hypothetical protein D6768_20960 [Chloroflexota bacterium]